MSAEFRIDGLAELLANLQRLGMNSAEAAAPALYQEGETIMTDSKSNYVPVGDTGVLRSSGYVADPVIRSDNVEVELGYGGAASAYAVVQHENLEYKHREGKTAKYLEIPLMAAEREMDERLANRIWRSIEGLIR